MIKNINARIGTAAEWAGTTPAAGTFCIESDTGVLKLADGTTVYGSLAGIGSLGNLTLPTSDPGVAGRLWRSGNMVLISTG